MLRRQCWLTALVGIVLALGPLAVGLQAAEGSFDRTLRVTGPVELEVTTGSGNIQVRTGDSASVHVHGIIKTSGNWGFGSTGAEEKVRRLEANPPIMQDGNFIRIGRIEDRELRRNVSVSYELSVPAHTQAKAEAGSGNVSLEGIDGPARAESGSGNVTAENIGNELSASSGSGDIHLNSIKGSVHGSTGSGTIRATSIAGAFLLSTGSGDVRLGEIAEGGGKVSTGSGNVEVTGVRGSLRVSAGSGNITAEGEPAGDWTLHSGSGEITLRLPAKASFDLDAHTDSGQIHFQRTITSQGTMAKGTLRGRVGSGGSRIEVRTGSGDIRIE